MKKISVILFLVLCCAFAGCSKGDISISSNVQPDSSDKYIIQTPLYQVVEIELGKYEYKIGTSNKVFTEGTKLGTEPQIDDIGNGVIRLFMGYGTNAFSVQYFDVWEEKESTVFNLYSVFTDYVNKNNNTYLFAYFDFLNKSLVIRDMFDDNGFYAEINKGNESIIYNDIIILNQNQIYLDYTITDSNNKSKTVQEVIKFK